MTNNTESESLQALLAFLKRKALSLLARREYARFELSQKLLAALNKELPELDDSIGLVEEVLQSMEESGYLSDGRYADMLLRSRVGKGYGPGRIRQELKQQRVSNEIMQLCLEETSTDWFELAKETKLRRFGSEVPSDQKQRAKQMRFLYGRGFSNDQINYAMSPDED